MFDGTSSAPIKVSYCPIRMYLQKDRCISYYILLLSTICLEQKRKAFINITSHIFSFKLYFPVFIVHLVNNEFYGSLKLSLMCLWGLNTKDFSIGYFLTVRTNF